MRTIKFRGKVLDSQEWVYGLIEMGIVDGYEYTYIRQTKENGGFTIYEVEKETIGQFIGLCDDFGVEIFEGDITRCTNLMEQGLGDEMICEIVYDEDLACFELKAEDRQRCLCTSILDIGISVIGNIHDRKEKQNV